MHRARRAALVAFVLSWSVLGFSLAGSPVPVAFATPDNGPAVAWPVSTGLLIAEVVTGGPSASDEYFELTNAGPSAIDLNGLEVAYASSAGTSATRRVGWTAALLLNPGRHLLVANSAGIFAAQADATYTAGIAATGGTLVLRPTGGTPIDAVGWGDATNAFVETSPAVAPTAGTSIERGPEGTGGNVRDSNNNAADFVPNAAPVPENLAAPARPAPGAGPTPSPRPTPTGRPTPTATPTATPTVPPRPTASPTPVPTPSASPSARPSPSPRPTPVPTPTSLPSPSPTTFPTPIPTAVATPTPTPSAPPMPSPTPVPTPSPAPIATASPTPTPATISIADALARGGTVTIAGVVTAGPSLIDTSGRLVIVQDQSAAVEVRLPAANTKGAAGMGDRRVVPGMSLIVHGLVGRAYGAPRLTVASVTWLGQTSVPAPLPITTPSGNALEWRLVIVTGRLDAIHRLGLRWRAEIAVGTARIPIAGLAGAGIAVAQLFTGRRVTITGIVRRAYPTAIDRRFAIEPRFLADIAFDRADPAPPRAAGSGGGSDTPSGSVQGATFEPSAAPALLATPTVDLRDLGSLVGRLVDVSGIVTALDGTVISLDDGTATGRLKLTGGAAQFLDLVEVGDPLEVSGQVSLDGLGPFLLVTDPDGVRQAGDPVEATLAPQPAATSGEAGARPSPVTDQIEPGLAHSEAPGRGGSGLAAVLETLVIVPLGALFALAVAILLIRRRANRARPAGPQEGPRARSTLGPS